MSRPGGPWEPAIRQCHTPSPMRSTCHVPQSLLAPQSCTDQRAVQNIGPHSPLELYTKTTSCCGFASKTKQNENCVTPRLWVSCVGSQISRDTDLADNIVGCWPGGFVNDDPARYRASLFAARHGLVPFEVPAYVVARKKRPCVVHSVEGFIDLEPQFGRKLQR